MISEDQLPYLENPDEVDEWGLEEDEWGFIPEQ